MIPPWLGSHDEGTLLSIRAAPGASRDRILGTHGAALKVAVTAPPEAGRANKRLVALLAEALDLPRRSIVLVSGTTSRDKRLLIRGLAPETVARRLAVILDS